MVPRIVLAFSGSFETSLAIPWLKERHGADVIALTLDFGQGRELEEVRDRALAGGAARAHVLDVRGEFAREFALRSLKADALDAGRIVLSRPLVWPLIARKLVDIAEIEQASAVAHGARSVGDSAAHLDRLVAAVSPRIVVMNPPSEWNMGDEQQAAFAAAHGVAQPAGVQSCFEVDANLWGRSIRCAGIPPESSYTLTKAPLDCPAEPASVEIAFERGVPTAINGVVMPLLELIASLGTIGGAHGVGRVRLDGTACEAPAALLLHAAHRELQSRIVAPDLAAFARTISRTYVDVLRNGQWFTVLREALDAFVDTVQDGVTGTVGLKLLKGDLVTD